MNTIITLLTQYGFLGIMIAAFCEAIFLPVPMEVISLPIYLAKPKMALLYAVILILFSTMGSIIGYWIAKFFGNLVRRRLVDSKYLRKLQTWYDRNAFLAILTSSFTPVPYEAYVLSAGLLAVNFRQFLVGSIISRLLRHLPQGILLYFFGDTIASYSEWYTIIVAVVITLFIVFKYVYSKKKEQANSV